MWRFWNQNIEKKLTKAECRIFYWKLHLKVEKFSTGWRLAFLKMSDSICLWYLKVTDMKWWGQTTWIPWNKYQNKSERNGPQVFSYMYKILIFVRSWFFNRSRIGGNGNYRFKSSKHSLKDMDTSNKVVQIFITCSKGIIYKRSLKFGR